MPELPEVEALRDFLDGRLAGREIARVLPLAVSVLKTYDPPVAALEGATVTAVARHGKFLDITADQLHLVTHLARAGWIRWKDSFPATPPRPGKGPLALRVMLTGGDGFDLTEMGTTKRLSVHLVRDPREIPGVARLGPDPLDTEHLVIVALALRHSLLTFLHAPADIATPAVGNSAKRQNTPVRRKGWASIAE